MIWFFHIVFFYLIKTRFIKNEFIFIIVHIIHLLFWFKSCYLWVVFYFQLHLDCVHIIFLCSYWNLYYLDYLNGWNCSEKESSVHLDQFLKKQNTIVLHLSNIMILEHSIPCLYLNCTIDKSVAQVFQYCQSNYWSRAFMRTDSDQLYICPWTT